MRRKTVWQRAVRAVSYTHLLFLDGKIGFADIAARVAHALDSIPYQRELTLDGVLAADAEARRLARA